jgi:phosphatidylserine/phosphatidylglycerophosphate/cardiolipin synthase-like enzyme
MRHALVTLLLLAACGVNPGTGDDTSSQDDAGDNGQDASTDDASQTQNDSGTTQSDSGTTIQESTNISIIVEPDGQSGAQVVSAINAAKTSVHMTMYLLSNTSVINALIARHKAGVDVKVLLDSSTTTSNTSVYNQLKSAGVSVAWSSTQFTFTHEKCVIIDGKTAWIMTMNLTQSSPDSNREYLAIDTTPGDITEAEAIFAGDFTGKPPTSATGPLVVAPINAVSSIVNLINSAKTTIDLEGEELSDYHTADALKAALGRGVKVRVVLSDVTQTSSGQAAVAEVKGAGGKLVTVSTPYIHAKTLVADGTTAYVGSENFSTGSLQYNRELGVIFSIPSEVQKITSTISTDFSKGTAL